MIQNSITKLIQYGLETGLIEKEDTRYAANKVLELLKIDSLDEDAEQAMADYVPGSSEVVGELERTVFFWKVPRRIRYRIPP